MKKLYIIKRFIPSLYWTSCGWTEFRKQAQKLPSKADQELKIRQMERERLMAQVLPYK
jgi:hypothetical protein